MTDVLEVVGRARPDVEPIPPADRRRIREELFHDGRRTSQATADAAMVVPWQTRRRSRQLVVIVGLVLVVGLTALFVLRDGGDDQQPDVAAGTDTTVAVEVAETPAADDPADQDPVPPTVPVVFDPVLPTTLPGGYFLHWARYDGDGPEAVGLARYINPDGGPEIALFVRPTADVYTGPVADEAQTWRVAGRRLVAVPNGGPCAESSCGVNVQWNDQTAMSVSWVNWDGTTLDGAVDRAALVELVGGLRPQPAQWEQGSLDQADPSWSVPTADSAPLLLPASGTEISASTHNPAWPGSSSVALRAPDATFLSLQEGDAPQLERDTDELVERGAISYIPPESSEEEPLVYDLAVICGFAQAADTPGSAILRPTIRRLFDVMSIDRGEIAIRLGPSWRLIDLGANADVYAITFRAPEGEVTLLQAPGGSVAQLMYGRGPFKGTRFLGEAAWREQGTGDELRIISQRAGTPFEIRGRGLQQKQLAAVLGDLEPATLNSWAARFGETQPPDVDTSCPQQPFFNIISAG